MQSTTDEAACKCAWIVERFISSRYSDNSTLCPSHSYLSKRTIDTFNLSRLYNALSSKYIHPTHAPTQFLLQLLLIWRVTVLASIDKSITGLLSHS